MTCLMLSVVLLSAACGKKAPPVAPSTLRPVLVSDLAASADDCTVTLRWTLPKDGADGYIIYRARRDFGGGDCTDCPGAFREAGRLYVNELSQAERGRREARYAERVPCGFQYRYQIAGFTAGGMSGSPSNTADIFLPEKDDGGKE